MIAQVMPKHSFKGKSILVTGGTGTFGKEFCKEVLEKYNPARLIVYSRDEFKQSEMAADPTFQHKAMRFFLGDVRDCSRLVRAMDGVDIVVHAAALKQVPAAEYNPIEFIKTNINGATNVVEASLTAGVKKVVALSTDKAVNPINLYGATKLCSDKVFIAANSYRGTAGTQFSVVRYGNVLGSRGSVIPLFLEQKLRGEITVTEPDMTRFFMTVERGAQFVLQAIQYMGGGELFIPKMPSCKLQDIIDVIAPGIKQENIGMRPGEKMHEVLITEDLSRLALEYDSYFIIQPVLPFWELSKKFKQGTPCPDGFSYRSDNNNWWFTKEEILFECIRIARELDIKVDLEQPLSA